MSIYLFGPSARLSALGKSQISFFYNNAQALVHLLPHSWKIKLRFGESFSEYYPMVIFYRWVEIRFLCLHICLRFNYESVEWKDAQPRAKALHHKNNSKPPNLPQ